MALSPSAARTPWTTWAFPLLALGFYALAALTGRAAAFEASVLGIVFAAVLLAVLFGAVFAAVHHAEVIAHRTGEPYGTLILTMAVTVIETALIVSVMLSENGNPAIARDTVYAVVMIVCAGLVGLCLFVGGLHHHEQSFRVSGATAYLAVLLCEVAFTLILPNATESASGPVFTPAQLAFVSAVTVALYGAFLYMQTVRHRDYFIMSGPWKDDASTRDAAAEGRDIKLDAHGHAVPTNRAVTISLVLLLAALTGVILLAKSFAAVAEAAVSAMGAPQSAVGVIVAVLILLPEGVAALQAARRDELQKSINLALGSCLATIGLTIPAVAALALALDQTLVLGLAAKDMLLILLILAVSMLTFGTGRTNMLFGVVHLVVFATFLFLTFVP